jgi:DNA repair exonuclease SbcCD ATPase subunit
MLEKNRAEYQREREALNDQITSRRSQVNALENEIRTTLKEVRENLPRLLQEEEELKRRLNRAEQFEAVVGIAKETLEQLASEVYKVWAEVLNNFAADAFQKILPYYEDPRFDNKLHFTFVIPGHQGRIDPVAEAGAAPRLSGGELEQVHLIARFAISEYLSHGGVRPTIILDEPFSYSHDDPFVAGMQLLAQLSQQRQVIVLTCHEVRHRWLLKKASELKKLVHEVTFEGKYGFPLVAEGKS